MSVFVRLFAVLCVLLISGCGGGALLHQPAVYQSDVNQARQTLTTHHLAPSLNLSNDEMLPRLDRVLQATWPAILQTCHRVFSRGCDESMGRMRVTLVPDMSVNAYADASRHTIGIHAGFMRSAGDDDEIAAVIAHEAAHLLFGHAQKKASNAASSGLLTGIAMGAIGVAMHRPGMDTGYIEDMTRGGFEAGYTSGYVAYSPEMELEADQFAMYALKQADMRLSAGTDLIVRLHRGEVPAPVRQGDGWAGYLQTHPSNDYRLAAMQATLDEINAGADRPISQAQFETRERERIAQQNEARQREIFESAECVALRRQYPDCNWWQGEYDWLYITRCPSPFGHACQ